MPKLQLRWPSLFLRPQRRLHAVLRETQRGQRRYQLGPVPAKPPKRLPTPRLPQLRLAIAITILTVTAAGIGGGYWLIDSSTLRIHQADVVGAEIADPLTIVAAADIGGRSLLSLDRNETAARIVANLPEVKAAVVHRDWPQGVVITITEHSGWGYWQAGGRRVVIDTNGLVLQKGRPPEEDAITIFEIGAQRPLRPGDTADANTVATVAQLMEDARSQRLGLIPERFEFHKDRGLVVRVQDGPDAIFGDWHNYAFKVAAWGALLNRIERERLEIAEIDLRFGRQLVLR